MTCFSVKFTSLCLATRTRKHIVTSITTPVQNPSTTQCNCKHFTPSWSLLQAPFRTPPMLPHGFPKAATIRPHASICALYACDPFFHKDHTSAPSAPPLPIIGIVKRNFHSRLPQSAPRVNMDKSHSLATSERRISKWMGTSGGNLPKWLVTIHTNGCGEEAAVLDRQRGAATARACGDVCLWEWRCAACFGPCRRDRTGED